MRRGRPPRPFPYAERAREAAEAREAVDATFRAMRAAKVDRNDPTAATAVAWQSAVARFHAAVARTYPPDFWDALDALKRGERSGIEEGIGFLEADPWFFHSGYVKAEILRALKRVELEPAERRRLHQVILHIVDRRDGREFRDYCRLAAVLATPAFRVELESRVNSSDRAIVRRAGWMLAALGAEPSGRSGHPALEG